MRIKFLELEFFVVVQKIKISSHMGIKFADILVLELEYVDFIPNCIFVKQSYS